MVSRASGRKAAHVIVLGSEKGGSGKSTTAVHICVALLKAGFTVASIDTDSRQRSLSRYLENRSRWARAHGLGLELPAHFTAALGRGEGVRDIEAQEFAAYAGIIDRVEGSFDFVVVDTPASDSYLMRLSHAMADTLITPVNDSFVDLDILGRVDLERPRVVEISHYAELVCAARSERLRLDGDTTDWVVVRNRVSSLANRNQARIGEALKALSLPLGFRIADGITERVIFREFFPQGLTAFDRLDRETLGREPTMSHLAARREIRDLVERLGLPTGREPATAALAEAEPLPPAVPRDGGVRAFAEIPAV